MSSVVVITVTGLEIKKVLSLSQVTSCRNIVARCQVNLQNPQKHAKYRAIC